MKQISPNMNFILANNEETAKDTHTSGTIGVLQLVLVPPRTNFSVLVVTKYSHKPFELKWNSLQNFHMPSSSVSTPGRIYFTFTYEHGMIVN